MKIRWEKYSLFRLARGERGIFRNFVYKFCYELVKKKQKKFEARSEAEKFE